MALHYQIASRFPILGGKLSWRSFVRLACGVREVPAGVGKSKQENLLYRMNATG
jgi:hypothetical protein